MEEELIVGLECPCGNVFEPVALEVDPSGERWARCPKCNRKIQIPADF